MTSSEAPVNGTNESSQSIPFHSKESTERPLNIAVIGAGLSGLAFALASHPQGHKITVYESSKFSREIGAAIHITSNANGILKRIGVSSRAIGANECLYVANYSFDGRLLATIPAGKFSKIWQHKWRLGHRIRLHDALKKAVLEKKDIEMKLGCPVKEVDSDAGIIHFKDESISSVKVDVIVGADGVHSVTRAAVPSAKDVKPFDSGKTAFRFLVPRQALYDDELTRQFVEKEGTLVMAYGPDRRIVMYPTTDNTLINFVCIHPSPETDHAATGDWNNVASRELVLQVYRDWSDGFRAALSKADPESIRVWKLLDMEVLDTWVHGKLALTGDAAHPFLPHQGQGGAQAMEDSVALAVVLEKGLRPEEVPERLKLYEQIRKERAHTVQQFTRLAGKDLAPGEKEALNMMTFTNYNYGHDEFDFSRQKLRDWKWAQNSRTSWKAPLAFGPTPESNQYTAGGTKEDRAEGQGTKTTMSMKIKTSRTVLQNFFPSAKLRGEKAGSWKFSNPGTVAYCTFAQTTINGTPQSDGQSVKSLALYLHGVEYSKQSITGKVDESDVVRGSYMPILFESDSESFVDKKEQFEGSKIVSNIDTERDDNSYQVRASYGGLTWGRFEVNGLTESSDDKSQNGETPAIGNGTGPPAGPPRGPPGLTIPSDLPILVSKYEWPAGDKSSAPTEASCQVLDTGIDLQPTSSREQHVQKRVWKSKEAEFKLYPRTEKALPTLHHIIERLAEIPIYEVVEAKVEEEVLGEHHGQMNGV